MAREERKSLLQALAEERGTDVITYITSTRSNLEGPMPSTQMVPTEE